MSSPVPLKKDTHAKLKVTESSDFRRYKDSHLIPIVSQDFFSLSAEFPLVFVKKGKTEEFIPVAVMGLKDGQNLYCQSETWTVPVAPMIFGAAPFSIARADPQGDQLVILIEEDSPLLSETTGEPLFKEDGERTDYLQHRIEFMSKYAEQNVNTQAICKFLAEKNLLMTQQVQMQYRPNARRYNIDGIYTISEDALNALPDEDFLQMRKQGLIALIYAHLASLQQLRRISQKQYDADTAATA